MASSILKGLVANYGKLGYQLWHRPFKMASLVYEREIGADEPMQQGRRPLAVGIFDFQFTLCHVVIPFSVLRGNQRCFIAILKGGHFCAL